VLLLLLFAAGTSTPAARSPHGPALYAVVAADYRAGHRERALVEIRQWGRGEMFAGIQAVRDAADRWNRLYARTGELPSGAIDFRTVEAAALMHVEAGLLELQSLRVKGAESQFAAATSLVEWAHALSGVRLRLRDKLREKLRPPPDRVAEFARAFAVDLKIEPVALYEAIAAATLALGFPESAFPFAEKAKHAAPRDGEVLLLIACVNESLALADKARTGDVLAHGLWVEAEALFREALAADPTLSEARLRLGAVLLAEDRAKDAAPFLRQAAEEAPDSRGRYLALLFLGRAAEMQKSADHGAAFYSRAVGAWPESQAARLALARALEAVEGPRAAHPLVLASLADSAKPAREPDPWWSYPFGPRAVTKGVLEHLWQAVLGRSFAS